MDGTYTMLSLFLLWWAQAHSVSGRLWTLLQETQGVDDSSASWLYFLWIAWKITFSYPEDPVCSLTTVLELYVFPPSLCRVASFLSAPLLLVIFCVFHKFIPTEGTWFVIFKNWWLCVRMCVEVREQLCGIDPLASRNQIHVIVLVWQFIYSLSHFAGPDWSFALHFSPTVYVEYFECTC